jgi:hypothetical protein
MPIHPNRRRGAQAPQWGLTTALRSFCLAALMTGTACGAA